MDLIIDFTYKQPVKGALCNNRTKEILHFNTFQLISLAFVLQHFSRTPIHLKKAHDLVLPYQKYLLQLQLLFTRQESHVALFDL